MKRALILILVMLIAACQKKAATDSDLPSLPTDPGNSATPTPTPIAGPASGSVQNSNGTTIGTKVGQTPDGNMIQDANGNTFVLAERAGSSVVFSATLPALQSGLNESLNCVFQSSDCSGPCLIDANSGTPAIGALMLANQPHTISGPVWKAERYGGESVTAAYVSLGSRLDLYGDGPNCGTSGSSVDHYYQLDDVTSSYSTVDNSQWSVTP